MRASAPPCCIRRAPPAAPRASCGRCPEQPPSQQTPLFDFSCNGLWQYREGMIYLSPAPLYHSAPQAAVNLTIRMGGTVILMESFDPERYLELVQRWGATHSQLVPTMFSPNAEIAGGGAATLRPVLAGDRGPCRGALPGAGKGRRHQMVGDRSSTNITAPPKALASLPATAPNGSRIAALSARCCSANCIFSTRTCSPAPAARRAPSGSRPPRRLNISTIRTRPKRPARPTAA